MIGASIDAERPIDFTAALRRSAASFESHISRQLIHGQREGQHASVRTLFALSASVRNMSVFLPQATCHHFTISNSHPAGMPER